MNSSKHIIISVLFSLLIVVAGTIGYMIIEGWSLFDALYMTVITYSTVGYGEVHNISKLGRLYTILLIFTGVGFFLYVVGAVIQFMVEGKIRVVLGRRKLDKKIGRLKNHYIVCGYGRIGRVLCENLKRAGIALVVVEKNSDLIAAMDEDRVLYINDNAASETVLARAGIKRARGLVSALATDTDNVFLILTAKQLRPGLSIMARAAGRESEMKLRAAGATFIESPYEIGAIRMAQRIIRPTVTSFLDLASASKDSDIQMEEILVSPFSDLKDILLKDSGIRQRFNLIIIAIKRPNDSMVFNPSFDTLIKAGDTVIAVGGKTNLKKLESLLNP